ncbi:MAG: hypothetical protein NTX00_04110 [Candidatus Parcubacteria bacterium]|nr:hypothetical protein [Candidatus Parcubacteria bacterium]
MVEEKYICPVCGFESNGSGLCPLCDETLEKVCACGSGKFTIECCGPEQENKEAKKKEALIKAEVAGETLTEMAKEDAIKQKEEEELAKVEEIKEEE